MKHDLSELLKPVPDANYFTATWRVKQECRYEAQCLADSNEAAIDQLKHDTLDWKLVAVNGVEIDPERMRIVANAHAKALARLEVDLWQRVAFLMLWFWALERFFPLLLRWLP